MTTPTSPLTVEETILQVIAHTMQIRREHEAKMKARRHYPEGDPRNLLVTSADAFNDDDLEEMMNGPGDPRDHLLTALSDTDVRKVEVLVYAGRLRNLSLPQAAKNVRREGKDTTVSHLVGSMGNVLDELLLVGWAKVIKERGTVGLDDWDPDAQVEEDDEDEDYE